MVDLQVMEILAIYCVFMYCKMMYAVGVNHREMNYEK